MKKFLKIYDDSSSRYVTVNESDVKFVTWDEIPWDELAFATVEWGLEHAREMKSIATPVIQERTKLITEDGKWEVEEG